MGNLWLKIKVWTKITIGVALVLYGLVFVYQNSSRPVMHIRIFAREAPQGIKWRGGALAEFDGKRWSNPAGADVSLPLESGQVRLLEPPYDPGLYYHVDLNASDTDAIFLAGIPVRLEMRQPLGEVHRVLAGPRTDLQH